MEDRGFLAIHKSYLVNYLHIESCRSTDVTMDNGEILPISRARQKAVAERLMHLRQGGKKAEHLCVSLFCTLLQTYVLYRYYLIFFHKKRTPLLLECSSYLFIFCRKCSGISKAQYSHGHVDSQYDWSLSVNLQL